MRISARKLAAASLADFTSASAPEALEGHAFRLRWAGNGVRWMPPQVDGISARPEYTDCVRSTVVRIVRRYPARPSASTMRADPAGAMRHEP
eukprot:474198-Prymnesium_polylepis.1